MFPEFESNKNSEVDEVGCVYVDRNSRIILMHVEISKSSGVAC